MARDNQITVRVSENRVEKIDSMIESLKKENILPPSATQSDIIRLSIMELIGDWQDEDREISDKVRDYYFEE